MNKQLLSLTLASVFIFCGFVYMAGATDFFIIIDPDRGSFSPSSLEIKEGDRVTWRNKDTNDRTVASDDNPDINAIGKMPRSTAREVFFNKSGTFRFYDKEYPWRNGTIKVIDDIKPDPITDLTIVSATTDSITLEWTETGDNGSEKVASYFEMYYADVPLTDQNFYFVDQVDTPAPIGPGTVQRVTVGSLAPATEYFFGILIVDEAKNRSEILPMIVSGVTLEIDGSVPNTPSEPSIDPETPVVTPPDSSDTRAPYESRTDASSLITALQSDSIDIVRDIALEDSVEISYASVVSDIPTRNFVAYGFDVLTNKMGAGERAALVNSFKDNYQRQPQSDQDWVDILSIAAGNFPMQRSLDSERAALVYFQQIYARNPVFATAADERAIWIISYGIRAEKRDLAKERAGITGFRNVYKRDPSSAKDWDVVRAIGYSGVNK